MLVNILPFAGAIGWTAIVAGVQDVLGSMCRSVIDSRVRTYQLTVLCLFPIVQL